MTAASLPRRTILPPRPPAQASGPSCARHAVPALFVSPPPGVAGGIIFAAARSRSCPASDCSCGRIPRTSEHPLEIFARRRALRVLHHQAVCRAMCHGQLPHLRRTTASSRLPSWASSPSIGRSTSTIFLGAAGTQRLGVTVGNFVGQLGLMIAPTLVPLSGCSLSAARSRCTHVPHRRHASAHFRVPSRPSCSASSRLESDVPHLFGSIAKRAKEYSPDRRPTVAVAALAPVLMTRRLSVLSDAKPLQPGTQPSAHVGRGLVLVVDLMATSTASGFRHSDSSRRCPTALRYHDYRLRLRRRWPPSRFFTPTRHEPHSQHAGVVSIIIESRR